MKKIIFGIVNIALLLPAMAFAVCNPFVANTVLTASALNSAIASPCITSGTITGSTVSGITIDSSPIGASVPGSGQFTYLKTTGVDPVTGVSHAATVYGYTGPTSTNAGLALRTARGTSVSPTATLANDIVGDIDFYGYSGTAFIYGASLDAVAYGNWSGTSTPTSFNFNLTPIGSTTYATAAQIYGNSLFLVGTTTIPTAATTGNTTFAAPTTGDSIATAGGILSLSTEAAGNYNFTGLGYSAANTNNASIGLKSQTRGAAITSSGDTFGNVDAFGWSGTAYAYSASIDFVSAGTWTAATSYPSAVTINTTASGSTAPALNTTFASSGVTLIPGLNASGAYTTAYTNGAVLDYTAGHGRLSVGAADDFTIYNGGVANTAIAKFATTGAAITATTTNNNAATGNIGQAEEAYCPNTTSTASVAFTLATPTVGTWAGATYSNPGSGNFTNIICPMNITATAPTGLATATNYWIVPINATTFHVASSAANAAAGTFLAATGSTTTTTINTSVANTSTTAIATAGLIVTAGDWDCNGSSQYTLGASTSVTALNAGVSQSSTALGNLGSYSLLETAANVMTATANPVMVSPVYRESLSASTPIYEVSSATFTVSTANSTADLRCRRMR